MNCNDSSGPYILLVDEEGKVSLDSNNTEPEVASLKPTSTDADSTITFETDKGVIDVIWLKGATNTPSNPQKANAPNVESRWNNKI